MYSIRRLLPCARLLGNQSEITNKFLVNHTIKRLLGGSTSGTRFTRSFASNTSSDSDKVLIYYGTLAPRMKAVKVFSLSTSLAGIAAQPILMEQGMKIGGAGMAVAMCTFGGFFTFVTPLLLHFITKKYVTQIYYSPKTDEYTATTISLLMRKMETKFKASDVVVPDVPGMFTSFKVGDKALFVDPALFDNTDHYVKIMGYDKPIDFKLDVQEDKSKPGSSEDSSRLK